MTPDRQRGRMHDAEPPMDANGNKENRAHQKGADTTDYRKGAAPRETIQVCLISVHYDQYPEDREADCFADQADSSRDPLKDLSTEHQLGRFDFRL